jgi:hypothetical protein
MKSYVITIYRDTNSASSGSLIGAFSDESGK